MFSNRWLVMIRLQLWPGRLCARQKPRGKPEIFIALKRNKRTDVISPPYPQSISTLRPVLLGPRDSQGEMEADPWAAFGPRNNGPKVHVSGRGDGDVARLCSPPPARQGSLPLGSFRSSLWQEGPHSSEVDRHLQTLSGNAFVLFIHLFVCLPSFHTSSFWVHIYLHEIV